MKKINIFNYFQSFLSIKLLENKLEIFKVTNLVLQFFELKLSILFDLILDNIGKISG